LTAAQKQLLLKDNGLPFCVNVKAKRDHMYNDTIAHMRKMGIHWTDPLEPGALQDKVWYIDGHHSTIAYKTLC